MEMATSVLEAAKLTGRAGEWTLGTLHALTGRSHAWVGDSVGVSGRRELVEPLTNYVVARAIRNVGQRNGAIGALFTATNRFQEDAPALLSMRSSAYAAGIDGWGRFGRAVELSGSFAGSLVQGSREAIDRTQRSPEHYFQRPDAQHLTYDPTRTELSGYAGDFNARVRGGNSFQLSLGGHARSPGFEVNDLGFQRDSDIASQFLFLQQRGSSRTGGLRSWSLGLTERGTWTFGGEQLETNFTLDWRALFRGYAGASATFTVDLPALSTTALRGGPAVVAPGWLHATVGLHGDRRRSFNLRGDARVSLEYETGGRLIRARAAANLRPSTWLELSLEPSVTWETAAWQHVTQRLVQDTMRYIVGALEQNVLSLTGRADLTIAPTVSLQMYAQSFVNGRDYRDFRQLAAPRATRFDQRFPLLAPGRITYDDGSQRYGVDVNADGVDDLTFPNPALNFAQVRANVVFRWEYLPGSTLFLVYTHDTIADDRSAPDLDFERDVGRLFRFEDVPNARLEHAFLIKLSYWLGL
jgi:hypothetical protein